MNILHQIRVSSRKIWLPIKLNSLVVDVGSGGNPHLWADVTTDMYEDNTQRFSNIKFKGLFVWADAENLPFRDLVFDYSVSSHVLEHTPNPEKMITELQRISCAGYIETPPSWMELASPYAMHFSRVTQVGSKLIFKLKNSFDEKLSGDMADIQQFMEEFQRYSRKRYTPFHVQKLYWKDKIDFEVIRSKDYEIPKINLEVIEEKEPNRKFYAKVVIFILNFLFQFRGRNLNVLDICCCPVCKNSLFFADNDKLKCRNNNCAMEYIKHNGFFHFRIKSSIE